MFVSESDLLSVLDQADALIDAGAKGDLEAHKMLGELWDVFGGFALDGHESDEEERMLLERHKHRVGWIWRVMDELRDLCAEEDARKDVYIKAGCFGQAEALRRLRALVSASKTKPD